MKRTTIPNVAPPNPPAGWFFFHASPGSAGTAAHANGVLRLSPYMVFKTTTLDRIGVEVATAGDVGSLVRIGIYADSGNSVPGARVVDAGTVLGDSVTTQVLTISVTLAPGLYWMGAVGQNVTTTGPTLRIVGSTWMPPALMSPGTTSLPGSNATINGYVQNSVTGALPSAFTQGSTTTSSPRMILRAV